MVAARSAPRYAGVGMAGLKAALQVGPDTNNQRQTTDDQFQSRTRPTSTANYNCPTSEEAHHGRRDFSPQHEDACR